MKRFYRFFIPFIFLLTSTGVKAQFVPSTTFIHTPMGNIPVTTYYHLPQLYFHSKGGVSFNSKNYFLVKLKNDSTLKVYAKLDHSDSINSLMVYKNAKNDVIRRIYPNETKYILGLEETDSKQAGKANDSCWVFLQLKGYISLYGVTPTEDPYYSIFFTSPESEQLIALNEDNLLKVIGNDDEKIYRLLTDKKAKDYVKAVKAYNKKHPIN